MLPFNRLTARFRMKEIGYLFASITLAIACLGSLLNVLGKESQTKPQNLVLPQGTPDAVPYRGLDASLYMLTSAEYRAVCHQTFRWAEMIVQLKLQLRRGSETANSDKPTAIIMDLDETILDNGWFQSQQIRDRVLFDMNRWSTWEQKGSEQIRAIPGAIAFIKKIRELGVAPIYISNRNTEAIQPTIEALKRLDIDVPESQILFADSSTGSDKTSRRAQVQETFEVVLYLGDNLRDFDERFKYDSATGVEGRNRVVDELSDKFGIDWILLPNPSYGEWTKVLKNTIEDVDLLYK
ncbi:5'-nucleotidase, lipoprotein e(P4) family [Pirellulaceae bacterium SH449]